MLTRVAGTALAGDFFTLATVFGLGFEITEEKGVVLVLTMLLRGATAGSAVGRWMLVPCTINLPQLELGTPRAGILHVYPVWRVYYDVSRLALLVWLAVGTALPADTGLSRTLQAIEDRYNRAQTLQIAFSEAYTAQGKAWKPENGVLFLRKPGRMRWEYSSPKGKLFLSDAKFVYLVTPDSNRVQKMKAKETEDMRAPLAFLLGRLHFEKDFRNFQSRPEGPDTWITAEPKSPDLAYTKVEFQVTPQMQIRRLLVTGQDHSVHDFHFDQEKLNPPLDSKLFRFELPPGAMLEESVN